MSSERKAKIWSCAQFFVYAQSIAAMARIAVVLDLEGKPLPDSFYQLLDLAQDAPPVRRFISPMQLYIRQVVRKCICHYRRIHMPAGVGLCGIAVLATWAACSNGSPAAHYHPPKKKVDVNLFAFMFGCT